MAKPKKDLDLYQKCGSCVFASEPFAETPRGHRTTINCMNEHVRRTSKKINSWYKWTQPGCTRYKYKSHD